jgi:hypothetical protein
VPVAGARRRWPIIAVAVVALVLIGLSALSGFLVDLLWFREVGFTQVFWTILRTKAVLGIVFGLAFFVLLYANLLVVRLITPRFRTLTREQEVFERYRMAFEPYAWWLLPVFAAVIAVFVAFGAAGNWPTFALWRNSSGITFGTRDPLFHRDVAFYVFTLPWLKFVQGWLFSSLVGVTFIAGIAHYLWGGIRPQAPLLGDKVTPQVKAHLSVLLGLIVLTKAWGYYLGTFDLLTSRRGVVMGASYTDVKAQLPALRILAVIAVACAVLFLVNIRMRGWALPVIAVGLLALASVTAGAAYPAFVQQFRVKPQELQRERPYIVYNIAATRTAFGLDAVETQHPTVSAEVTGQQIKENGATISNIRLWRPDVLRENFESLERLRQYYEFHDVDVDRYTLDGERRVVMLSAREVAQNEIPGGGRTWQNQHLFYTHGFGAVAVPVNTATTEGAPEFTLQGIPPVGQPQLVGNGQRVYYGESSDVPFVVVDSGMEELDYQSMQTNERQVTSRYEGAGGIPIGGFFERALFAWRYRDVNLLISNLVTDQSRIMIYRDIEERVPRAAPFLRFDGDPYAAIVDGKLVWIWDAYTTTDQYPYSQEIDLGDVVTPGSGTLSLAGNANYVRNSVKVVVDAYDGTMTFYVADPSDPIIRVWERTFPVLFRPIADASADLLGHFRYPENLLQVQAAQYANYHVTDPSVFYGKQDFWQVPPDPTVGPGVLMRPYYVLMRLPGETEERFVLILPFTPLERPTMVAWMAANCDPGADYGKILSYEFASGASVVDGPAQVFSRINQDPQFSQERTLLGQGGSEVLFGDFLVIPIDTGLLYVEPVYVRSKQTNAIPELKRVVVVNGGRVGVGYDLQTAIADSLSGQAGPTGGGAPGGTVEQQIAALLQRAADHFAAAQTALRAGDLATYQAEVNAAEAAVQQANQLAKQVGASPAASAVSPTPGPSS